MPDLSVVSWSQQLPSLDGQVRGMESSAMAINPQQPNKQSGSLEHSIMSIDNHWQDLELVPFSSQDQLQTSNSFGHEERQPTAVDEYDLEQHAEKYVGEAPYNGLHQGLPTGSNQAGELKASASASISSSVAPKLGMQKMQPRQRHSQRKPSPKSTKAGGHSSPSVTDKESAPANQLTPSNQVTKIQSRPSGSSEGMKKAMASKRVKQIVEPALPPEPSTESSQSVRSKMRESLAAALKLVSDEGNDAAAERKELSATKGTLDKAQHEAKSGDVAAEVCDNCLGNNLECPKEIPAETDIQKTGGVNSSSVTVSDTNESNKLDTMWEAGNRNASTGCDVSADQKSKDDLQSSSGLSLAPNVGSEGCEDKDGHVSKKLKLTHGGLNEVASETPRILASEIENKLFRLFGGVNKKYKEKGRSLLFNLKDRHNPELRKRVFFGEISPERLCSMTAEELASKELTQWRIAKAEELAQMVVLPDPDKEFKSFVKKTHKGEVEVEVERDDSVSVEVVLDGNAFSKVGYKGKEDEDHHLSNFLKKDDSPAERSGSGSMLFDNLTSGHHENTDFMQDLMVEEEFRDSKTLLEVPTLDEFMKDLDEEPPFQNMLAGSVQGSPSPEKGVREGSKANGDIAACNSGATVAGSLMISRKLGKPQENSSASTPSNVKIGDGEYSPVGRKGPVTWDMLGIRDSADVRPSENDDRFVSSGSMGNTLLGRSLSGRFANTAVISEPVWEGLIQLNISSLVTALGFYRSGVKASMKDWPSFLEIKGRVRLDSFEKFLQDLRLCRSRAIMILQLSWKEGSPESGRVKLCETIDSYVADKRVGFADPLPGLELYFCPPHPNTTQILKANLSKEHAQAGALVQSGFICVAVWRTSPAASPEPPPSSSSLPKQQRPVSAGNVAHDPNVRNHPYHTAAPPPPPPPGPPAEEELEDDDVPPGFGPSAMAPRDEDDLPEFDFVQSTSTGTSNIISSPPGYASSALLNRCHQRPTVQPPPTPPAAAGPVEHFRELINKYGHNQNQIPSGNVTPAASAVVIDDDDDDDIPEWQPVQRDSQFWQPPLHQQYAYARPPPPPPPPLSPHYNQQPNQMMVPPSEHPLVPPSNYNPQQQHRQFGAVRQWAAHTPGGVQPWRGAERPMEQQRYCGRPARPWRPAAGHPQPQRGMGRNRGGHFPRG